GSPQRGDHVHLTMDQISRQCRKSIEVTRRPTRFDEDAPAFNVASLVKTLAERGGEGRSRLGCLSAQKADHRHPRLLRQRPRGPSRRTAEPRDELPASHSITSSAMASKLGGTVRPSALAVLMLRTSSYLVGACTGRSAGFSPLRMRST